MKRAMTFQKIWAVGVTALLFLAANHLSLVFHEHDQYFKRLLMEFYSDALSPQLARGQVNFKDPEADKARTGYRSHRAGFSPGV